MVEWTLEWTMEFCVQKTAPFHPALASVVPFTLLDLRGVPTKATTIYDLRVTNGKMFLNFRCFLNAIVHSTAPVHFLFQ